MIIDKACFEHLNRYSQLKIFFSIFCFCIVVYTLQGRIQKSVMSKKKIELRPLICIVGGTESVCGFPTARVLGPDHIVTSLEHLGTVYIESICVLYVTLCLFGGP
jgi:hypothetical protein